MWHRRFLSVAVLCSCGPVWPQAPPDPVPAAPPPASQDRRDPVFYAEETEPAKPLLRKFAINVWMDQKDIWTSPFHMNRQRAVPWVLVGLGTAALIATDRRSSLALPNTCLLYTSDAA